MDEDEDSASDSESDGGNSVETMSDQWEADSDGTFLLIRVFYSKDHTDAGPSAARSHTPSADMSDDEDDNRTVRRGPPEETDSRPAPRGFSAHDIDNWRTVREGSPALTEDSTTTWTTASSQVSTVRDFPRSTKDRLTGMFYTASGPPLPRPPTPPVPVRYDWMRDI